MSSFPDRFARQKRSIGDPEDLGIGSRCCFPEDHRADHVGLRTDARCRRLPPESRSFAQIPATNISGLFTRCGSTDSAAGPADLRTVRFTILSHAFVQPQPNPARRSDRVDRRRPSRVMSSRLRRLAFSNAWSIIRPGNTTRIRIASLPACQEKRTCRAGHPLWHQPSGRLFFAQSPATTVSGSFTRCGSTDSAGGPTVLCHACFRDC